MVTQVETRKNIIKDKRCCFVSLRGGYISKNCRRKIRCYKCSKRHHIALSDFEQNKNDKVHSQINNDGNETSCNFISPVNKVLLQTATYNCKLQLYKMIVFNITLEYYLITAHSLIYIPQNYVRN